MTRTLQSELNKTAELEGAILHQTEKAYLFKVVKFNFEGAVTEEQDVWFPKSQVELGLPTNRNVANPKTGAMLPVVEFQVPTWLAVKAGAV